MFPVLLRMRQRPLRARDVGYASVRKSRLRFIDLFFLSSRLLPLNMSNSSTDFTTFSVALRKAVLCRLGWMGQPIRYLPPFADLTIRHLHPTSTEPLEPSLTILPYCHDYRNRSSLRHVYQVPTPQSSQTRREELSL